MAKKVVSLKGKKWFAAYRNLNKFAKNKKQKLEKYTLANPNDKVAANCLENGIKYGFDWKRKTPKNPVWSHTDKYHSGLWGSLGYNGKKFIEHLKKLKRGPVKSIIVKPKVKEAKVNV